METTTAEMILQMKEEVGRITPIVVMVRYILIATDHLYLLCKLLKAKIVNLYFLLDPGNNCKGIPSTDWNCCSEAFPCRLGGGDCDED